MFRLSSERTEHTVDISPSAWALLRYQARRVGWHPKGTSATLGNYDVPGVTVSAEDARNFADALERVGRWPQGASPIAAEVLKVARAGSFSIDRAEQH